MNDTNSPATWALALANAISTEEWSALNNPGKITSRERKAAARVIQALVEEGAKSVKNPRSAKPGPKPRGKSNQTDDDIASLWSCIRMILELPSTTSLPSLSSKISSTLYHAREFTDKHLLLTTQESNFVNYQLTAWGRLPVSSDISEECACLPKPIGELDPQVSLNFWATSYAPLRKVENSHPLRSKRTRRLDATFVNFVRLLELHKAPLLKDERVTIHTDPRNEEWHRLEFHGFKSIKELRLQKKDILWTVIGKLVHLKTILHQANFVWTPIDADYLLNEIEIANNSSNRSQTKPDIHPVLAGLSTLKRIIISASDRQGISPFSSFLPSFFYKSLPSPTSPGQIVTS